MRGDVPLDRRRLCIADKRGMTVSAATTRRGVSPYSSSAQAKPAAAAEVQGNDQPGRWSLSDLPGWAVSVGIHGAVVLALLGIRFHLDQEQDPAISSALEELQRDVDDKEKGRHCGRNTSGARTSTA